MAVQTRIQLQNKSGIVQNETVANANTALRVGGLFDDFADSVTLNGERGAATLFVDSSTPYSISDITESVVDITMNQGTDYGAIFSVGQYSFTYEPTTGAFLRVSCQLAFTGVNNRMYSFWIAQDGNIIPQSKWSDTTQGNHEHTASCEAFVNASNNSVFEIYALANDNTPIDIRTLTFAAYTI